MRIFRIFLAIGIENYKSRKKGLQSPPSKASRSQPLQVEADWFEGKFASTNF